MYNQMTIIMGIDPGSQKTGYGVVEQLGNKHRHIACGTIKAKPSLIFSHRLHLIFSGVQQVVDQFQPNELAIEQVFMAKNASSALKLGQARGAAIVAATSRNIPVFEYETRKVKQAVAGTGAADKLQVQYMVKMLLNIRAALQEDAADALAVAMCHVLTHSSSNLRSQTVKFSKKRFQ